MLAILRLVIMTLVIIFASLFTVRILVLVLNRAPGFIVALSLIALSILAIAFYKGSFNAVGLRTKKSIIYAMIAFFVLLIISTAILIFVQ